MISLRRYLDGHNPERTDKEPEGLPSATILQVYCASLDRMSECGAEVCPDLAVELARGMKRIVDSLGQAPGIDPVIASELAVRDLLRGWGRQVASHYDQKATDVRDLLLVLSRTAESLGSRDDQVARHIDSVTEQLKSIASLDDVTRIRTSVEASARQLKDSLKSIAAEGKALVEHLRAEVATYQTKLEKAERVSSSDALTGLGSRYWVEGRIHERIVSGARFSIVLIDIDDFHRVVEKHGNLVGDLMLKEFARELRSACRFTDIVGRWGNDEFIILLDNAGPEVRAQIDRLGSAISRRYHVPGRTGYVKIPLTVALGISEYCEGDDVQQMLERADEQLCRERSRRRQERTA